MEICYNLSLRLAVRAVQQEAEKTYRETNNYNAELTPQFSLTAAKKM